MNSVRRVIRNKHVESMYEIVQDRGSMPRGSTNNTMLGFHDKITLDKCEKHSGHKVQMTETVRICRGIFNHLKNSNKENNYPLISEFLPDSKQYVITLYYGEKYWKVVVNLSGKIYFRIMGYGDPNGFYPVYGSWVDVRKAADPVIGETFYKLNRALEYNFGGDFKCYTSYCKDLARFTFWCKRKQNRI